MPNSCPMGETVAAQQDPLTWYSPVQRMGSAPSMTIRCAGVARTT
jgi:hypothetical protein